jgi:hypothetical protein
LVPVRDIEKPKGLLNLPSDATCNIGGPLGFAFEGSADTVFESTIRYPGQTQLRISSLSIPSWCAWAKCTMI